MQLLSRIFALLIFAGLHACAGTPHFLKHKPLPDDRQPIPEPKAIEINIGSDVVDKTITTQIDESLDLARQLRNVTGKRKRAYNADPFGEVPNSSWFTNRNGAHQMSLEELARGPNQGLEPQPSGVWTIIRAKTEGVTPGISIRDDRGQRWVLKFEPLGYPELNTGAEVVSTKLFYAAGYNTPENYIVEFDPALLRIGDNVIVKDKKGRKRQMSQADLEDILNRIQKLPDGRIRAVASKYVPGLPLGPFRYHGTRKDDPNDYIPHQHRRELRGLRIIAAWLNHFDTKDNNTIDVYLTEEKYIRHFLIDFGSTLGSQGNEPMPAHIGHENDPDFHRMAGNLFTLGFMVRSWEKAGGLVHPSVGYFESALFHPEKYKFILPNPAFELMTGEDAFWGTRIVTSFTDEQLRTAVAQGQYSDPEAAEYILRIIKERRDITGRYWFSKMTPADRFRLVTNTNGALVLHFDDLAIEAGLADSAQTNYRFTLKGPGLQREAELGATAAIPLPDGTALRPGDYYEIALQAQRGATGEWIKPVRIFAGKTKDNPTYRLLGVSRD